jgi:hypothetical protein
MLRNHRAVADGEDRFDVELDGATYPNLPAIPFRAWSRHRLIELYRGLPLADREAVDEVLESTGIATSLLAEPDLAHRYPPGPMLPDGRRRRVGLLEKLKISLVGTPHHLEVGQPHDLANP